MSINLDARYRYFEEQKLKKLINGFKDGMPETKPIGKDEDFLQTMKYIAKRLDFQIMLQIQMIKLLKNKK